MATNDVRFAAPAFPFGASVGTTFGAKDSVSVVTTSIVNILTTEKGTRPEDPEKGSLVPSLVFEILDEVTMSLIGYFTNKDLSEQEPRIEVRSVSAERDGEHRVLVQVGWSLVGDPDGQVYGTPIRYSQEV